MTPHISVKEPAPAARDITDRKLEHHELESLATGRGFEWVDPDTGRVYLLPVMRGGSLGSGAVIARNLPGAGSGFRIDPVRFAVLTSRNRKRYADLAWPGYGDKVQQRIDKVGVVSRLHIHFDGTLTFNTATATATTGFPWQIISRLKVSANGISNLFSLEGADLRALMRVRNGFFFDRELAHTIPTTGSQDLDLHWEVPIAFDDSLVGAVFAQTEDNELTVEIETATASTELFSANPADVAGNFKITGEFFSIPFEDADDGRILVLPDIRQLHGVVSKDEALTGTGEHTVDLMRTGGILVRTLQRFDNAAPSYGNVDPAVSILSHKFRYGSNVVPLDTTGEVARVENQVNYGDRVLPAADVPSGVAPHYLVDDFVIDNPVRDVVHLLGVSEPQLLNDISSSLMVNAGAMVHTVQEHMVAG